MLKVSIIVSLLDFVNTIVSPMVLKSIQYSSVFILVAHDDIKPIIWCFFVVEIG